MAPENEDKYQNTNPVQHPVVSHQGQNDEIPEDVRKGYVVRYREQVEFPFEEGEIVWIMKPEYRAPLGEFRIVKAHPDNRYELVRCNDDTPHSELVEAKDLRRYA